MKFRKILLPFIFFVIVEVFASHSFATTSVFTRSLKVGMRGEDVRELQRFLNTNTQTKVAETGPGSLGNETDYFGTATMRALIKFQEKYKEEILSPLGIAQGTGFLGKMTIAKLNDVQKKQTVSLTSYPQKTQDDKTTTNIDTQTTTSTISSPPSAEKGEVIVKYPSQYTGKAGTTISLYGEGFTSTGNTVYFDTIPAVKDIVSQNTGTLQFQVPPLPKGIYPLFVKNARGASERGAFFVITDGVSQAPTIESITPAHAARGETVTIKGTGFSATGNMVQASMAGVFENVASPDGKTLSFTIPTTLFPEASSVGPKYVSWEVGVYVFSENGMSNNRTFLLDM